MLSYLEGINFLFTRLSAIVLGFTQSEICVPTGINKYSQNVPFHGPVLWIGYSLFFPNMLYSFYLPHNSVLRMTVVICVSSLFRVFPNLTFFPICVSVLETDTNEHWVASTFYFHWYHYSNLFFSSHFRYRRWSEKTRNVTYAAYLQEEHTSN